MAAGVVIYCPFGADLLGSLRSRALYFPLLVNVKLFVQLHLKPLGWLYEEVPEPVAAFVDEAVTLIDEVYTPPSLSALPEVEPVKVELDIVPSKIQAAEGRHLKPVEKVSVDLSPLRVIVQTPLSEESDPGHIPLVSLLDFEQFHVPVKSWVSEKASPAKNNPKTNKAPINTQLFMASSVLSLQTGPRAGGVYHEPLGGSGQASGRWA